MLQPEGDLQEVGYRLGTAHQLTIPGPGTVIIQAVSYPVRIQQLKKRRFRILQNFLQSVRHQTFISGIKGFGVGTLLPLKNLERQEAFSSIPQQALFPALEIFILPRDTV